MPERILTTPLPNLAAPLCNVVIKINGRTFKGEGFLLPPWNSFLQQFVQQAPEALSESTTTFGMTFNQTANANGTYMIGAAATTISILLTRGNLTIDLTGQKIIPIRIGDSITVVFAGSADIHFLPD